MLDWTIEEEEDADNCGMFDTRHTAFDAWGYCPAWDVNERSCALRSPNGVTQFIGILEE